MSEWYKVQMVESGQGMLQACTSCSAQARTLARGVLGFLILVVTSFKCNEEAANSKYPKLEDVINFDLKNYDEWYSWYINHGAKPFVSEIYSKDYPELTLKEYIKQEIPPYPEFNWDEYVKLVKPYEIFPPFESNGDCRSLIFPVQSKGGVVYLCTEFCLAPGTIDYGEMCWYTSELSNHYMIEPSAVIRYFIPWPYPSYIYNFLDDTVYDEFAEDFLHEANKILRQKAEVICYDKNEIVQCYYRSDNWVIDINGLDLEKYILSSDFNYYNTQIWRKKTPEEE